MITLSCPHCQQAMQAPAHAAGKAARCPACHQRFMVPAAETSPPIVRPAPTRECRSCGELVRVGDMFCPHCGERPSGRRRRSREDDGYRGGGGGGGGGAAAATSTVVINNGSASNFGHWHMIHFILTLLTCGLWLPVWVIHFIIWSASR